VSTVWMQSDDGIDAFDSGMDYVLSHWDGGAAANCSIYKGNIVGFVHKELQSLEKFANGLAVYAAIVQEARRSLNDLMAACVDGWKAVTEQREASGLGVAITVLTGLSAAAIAAASGGAALPVFGTVVNTVVGAAGRVSVDLAADNHADVADAFLQASGKVITEAAIAIGNNVFPMLKQALEIVPSPPQAPGDLTDHGEFHPRSSQPDGVIAARTTSARPSVIEGRLDPRG
jgi:hypothetical protein